MPPPAKKVAELPDRVLPLTVAVPAELQMPPPAVAELPDSVLLLTVSVPSFTKSPLSMPPPGPKRPTEGLPTVLPDRVLSLTVSVPRLRMAPPRASSAAVPLGLSARPLPSMRFRLVRTTVAPAETSKIRDMALPLMVGVWADTLLMVTLWLRTSSPWVSTMGAVMSSVKRMVSPLWAWATA